MKKILIAMLVLSYSSFSQATLITTSGSAATGDASISFSQVFSIIANGSLNVLSFGIPPLDGERDAVRFTNLFSIEVNGVSVSSTWQDMNDGCAGCGLGPYIFFGGITLQTGDIVKISGTGSGGFYAFGSGNPANYTHLQSGNYALSIMYHGNVISRAVPEPATIAFFMLGLVGLMLPRFLNRI